MSARKIGLLLLILAFGATVETAWQVRGHVGFGPEGCRVIGGRFYGPSWSFEQTSERSLAATAPRIEVRNAFGAVRVSAGAPGSVQVRLRKVVFQPTEEKARAFADTIELRVSGDGNPLRIGTNRDELDRGTQPVGFETHLEIAVPAGSVVSLRNEHGRADVAGVAAAEVDSSFDGVSVERVAGDVRLDSRHGDVSVSDVGGALDLRSQHGSVEVAGVTGTAKLDVQHGQLTARRTGALQLTQQHGGVDVEGVAGDLVAHVAHGRVEASDVAGQAEVTTSFDGVRLTRVGGAARARVDHGAVSAEDVKGGLDVESSYDELSVTRLGGPLTATVHHGSVEGRGLLAGARVRSSGGDVTLDGVAGPVEVDLERGNANLLPRAPIAAPVRVSVVHGDARLDVPEGSRIDLETESRRGEVRSEVAGLERKSEDADQHRGSRLGAQLGGGGVSVKLTADGDVSLSSSAAAAVADRDIAAPRTGTPGQEPSGERLSAEEQPGPRQAQPAAEAKPQPKPRRAAAPAAPEGHPRAPEPPPAPAP